MNDVKNVKNLKNRKGQKSSSKNIKTLVSLLFCLAHRLPAPDKPQGENDSMPQVQVRSGKKVLVVPHGKHLSPDDIFSIDKIEYCTMAGSNSYNCTNKKLPNISKNIVCIAYLPPVPDTTALVTLRDKPQGENDSMPQVQVRSRKKVLVVLQKRVVPDTTALVTLRDKNLGGNDSMPSVHVRHLYVSNSNHHESCFKHITGSEFTTDYNWYGTLSFVTEHRATHSQYRHTGYKFKIYCKQYNISSTISDFTSAWSLY